MTKGPFIGSAILLAAVLMAACSSGDDDAGSTASTDPAPTTDPVDEPASDAPEGGCGVTLADVQALLPPDSGVTENSTPDPGRCNFTWDDDGPRGIDVATIVGGRTDFEAQSGQVPDGPDQLVDGTPYETLDVDADEAWAFGDAQQVSCVALRGDDLYAADVVFDGAAAGRPIDTDFLEICTQLLGTALS